ncbi:hypothetical protein GIB67_004713 [Kingdonia uniflora]|uniref:Uncharacterized protein n=1 Tax=Kingdonia uniflora TaxID=39325 RepID=A0A7J7P501_9MAGN|nr:hypothetical protein GIB67_004713 [Kingdonia uniflora]
MKAIIGQSNVLKQHFRHLGLASKIGFNVQSKHFIPSQFQQLLISQPQYSVVPPNPSHPLNQVAEVKLRPLEVVKLDGATQLLINSYMASFIFSYSLFNFAYSY